MEYPSEIESCTQSDSLLTTTQSTRSQDKNMSQEEQTSLRTLEKGISEATDENHAFAKKISSLLTKLGLEPNSLSNDVKESLEKVSQILRTERLRDLDDTTLQIVRSRKEVETKKKQREEKKLSLAYDDLSRKYKTFSNELDYLCNSVKVLESDVETAKKEEEDQYASGVQLQKKLDEYEKTVKKLNADLAEMQVEEIYPDKILQKYTKFLEISAELVELNKNINQYEGLPPNLVQAKIMLETKQREYESLEKEFLEKLNS